MQPVGGGSCINCKVAKVACAHAHPKVKGEKGEKNDKGEPSKPAQKLVLQKRKEYLEVSDNEPERSLAPRPTIALPNRTSAGPPASSAGQPRILAAPPVSSAGTPCLPAAPPITSAGAPRMPAAPPGSSAGAPRMPTAPPVSSVGAPHMPEGPPAGPSWAAAASIPAHDQNFLRLCRVEASLARVEQMMVRICIQGNLPEAVPPESPFYALKARLSQPPRPSTAPPVSTPVGRPGTIHHLYPQALLNPRQQAESIQTSTSGSAGLTVPMSTAALTAPVPSTAHRPVGQVVPDATATPIVPAQHTLPGPAFPLPHPAALPDASIAASVGPAVDSRSAPPVLTATPSPGPAAAPLLTINQAGAHLGAAAVHARDPANEVSNGVGSSTGVPVSPTHASPAAEGDNTADAFSALVVPSPGSAINVPVSASSADPVLSQSFVPLVDSSTPAVELILPTPTASQEQAPAAPATLLLPPQQPRRSPRSCSATPVPAEDGSSHKRKAADTEAMQSKCSRQ